MAERTISDNIRPISDLKSRDGETVTQAPQAAEHGVIVEALRQAERDVASGRILNHVEMRAKWLPGCHEQMR